MKNFISYLTARDKLLHLIGGIYLFLILSIVMPHEIACGVAIIIGIAKEIVWDKWLGKGTPEILDTIMTSVGALSIYIINTL